jgi:hypothetical protein
MMPRIKTNCPYHNMCHRDLCPDSYFSCNQYQERLSQERAIQKGRLEHGLSVHGLDKARRAGL